VGEGRADSVSFLLSFPFSFLSLCLSLYFARKKKKTLPCVPVAAIETDARHFCFGFQPLALLVIVGHV
jgi:hypothetical protein